MGRVPCDRIAFGELVWPSLQTNKYQPHEKLPHFRSTSDALVVTSVSIVLRNVALTAQCT